ncbi:MULTISPECIES: sortase [unclassified Streptomyces]|uniref:sortase n=1 Tax=unclassified Streptomyces TaxID=2593676 RepID=UPI00093B518E|nr:sortase [Streptomyces sp. TSRI0281]OKI32311.1 sortase [Streptomyces sp. TSRI0281]
MRNTRVGTGIGLVVGVLAVSVPVAVAADTPAGDRAVSISPRNVSPGSTVTVSTRACGKETYGKGTSELGGEFHLFAGDSKGELVGQFEIPRGAEPGSDTVTVKCPPRIKLTDTYEVTGRTPSGSVAAGFGSPTDQGTQLAVGGVLLAGAVGGGVIRMRRRMSGAGARS